MKEINKETIYDLPIHDSDFLGIHISQNDRGVTDLYLDIIFCKDEFEEISNYSNFISTEGYTTLVFIGCDWINVETFCHRIQRDSIDFIDFRHNTPELKKYSSQDKAVHLVIFFTSGTKIECISKKVMLKTYNKS